MGILLNKSKNYIINGAMDFFQRGTDFVSIANDAYFADRFQYFKSGTMAHTASRSTDVPVTDFPFSHSLRLNLTTFQGSLSAAQFCQIDQKMEGQIIAPLIGRTVTLSFWVKASLIGKYGAVIRNTPVTKSYIADYDIIQANTWEKKTITLRLDSDISWSLGSGIGIRLSFPISAGSNFHATSLNAWVDGDFRFHSSFVNGVQSGATDFFITGVQLEEGVEPSNFERAGGNIPNELQLCQRYYEKSYNVDVAPNSATPIGVVSGIAVSTLRLAASAKFCTTKRAIPSVRIISQTGMNDSASAFGGANVGITAVGEAVSQNNIPIVFVDSGFTQNVGYYYHWTADAEL